jgi:hypothetical protein
MPDFSNNFSGPFTRLRGRNLALPTTEANINEFNTLLVRWASLYDAAYQLDISSSSAADVAASGTGARTIDIYGLDKDFNPLKETIALNGQTKVTTVNSFRRVFEIVVATAGSGFLNAGDIYVVKGGTGGTYTAGVPGTLTGATIKALVGDNYGLSGLWTVPRNEKPYGLSSVLVSARAQSGTVRIWHGFPADPASLAYPSIKLDYAPADPVMFVTPDPLIILNPMEDVYLTATGATAGGFLSIILQFSRQGRSVY